jgi:streptogramin lyase
VKRASRTKGAALLTALVVLCFSVTAHAQPGITLQAGDIIVLDIGADSVEHIDPGTGVKTTLAQGSIVRSSRGVAFSPEGMVYVADSANDPHGVNVNEWIYRIDPDSGDLTFVASVPAIGLPDPEAMIADEASDWDLLLMEADTQKILRIDPALGLVSTEFELTGTRFPIGLTRDPTDGSLVVVDRFSDVPSENPGVHRVDVANGFQSAVSLDPAYDDLRRVGVQSDGDVIVSDHGNSTIWRIPAGTTTPEAFGSCGVSFGGPQGIAIDTDDSVLVTDLQSDTLHRINADGSDCDLILSGFSNPWEVAIVPTLVPRNHDEFLVSDSGTQEIYVADSIAETRAPIAGGSFTQPIAMAWTDPAATLATGEIFVIDGPTSIVRRNLANGTQTAVASGGNFNDLSDIAVDFAGNIIVTDRSDGQVIRVDPTGAPNGTQTVLTSELGEPTALVIDSNGSVIVADSAPVDDVDTNEFDSGLFRINPLNGDVEQFTILAGSQAIEFNSPIALARDPNSGLLLLDHGDSDIPGVDYDDPEEGPPAGADFDKLKPARLFRIIGAEGTAASAGAFAIATSVDDFIGSDVDDARVIAIDGNRDPIVAFASVAPVRIEPLTGAGTALMVGDAFNLVTDLLIEGMPAPGETLDDDFDMIPNGYDNCPSEANTDQADGNFDGQGDACQIGDLDMDGFPDGVDICLFDPNSERTCTTGLVGEMCLVDLDCIDPDAGLCGSNVCTEGRIGQTCTIDDDCDNPGPGVCTGSVCTSGLMAAPCTQNSDCDDNLRPGFCGPAQFDSDGDNVGTVCDNCPVTGNVSQADFDGNGIGDACEDSDGDGGSDFDDTDNCPGVQNGLLGGTCFAGDVGAACMENVDCDLAPGTGVCNTDQEDLDSDGVGDVCDNCPAASNPTQSDINNDGIGDACQNDLLGDDPDFDGWPNDEDNCDSIFNPFQSNVNAEFEVGAEDGDACESNDSSDGDGWPSDHPDNCPNDPNPSQYDSNLDGFGDPCQPNDSDNDGWPDDLDNCPDTFNPSFDSDGDGLDDGQGDVNGDAVPGVGNGDACQENDLDNDGWPDDVDNCPNVNNPSQGDVNGDATPGVGNGDACQLGDSDGDGYPDDHPDNCPYYPNQEQDDFNNDGIGDLCQNSDGEGLIDFLDNCPGDANPNHDDEDEDFRGDICDNCLSTPNGPELGTCFFDDESVGAPCESDDECDGGPAPGFCQLKQEDFDDDDIGDVCDPTPLPEPGGTLMLLTGLGGLAMLARRRGRREAAARA